MKNELKLSTKPLYKRLKKEELIQIIEQFNGLTIDICQFVQCSPRQFWNAVDHYMIRDIVGDSRRQLVQKAESEISRQLESDDQKTRLEAAKFILERLGKNEGWSKNPDVQQTITVEGDCDIRSIFGLQ